MTIIHSPKTNKKEKIIAGALAALSILIIFIGLALYNGIVNLRHDISREKISLREVEVKNAEFKDNFYSLANISKIKTIAEEKSLVLEKNPSYVKINNNYQLTSSRP